MIHRIQDGYKKGYVANNLSIVKINILLSMNILQDKHFSATDYQYLTTFIYVQISQPEVRKSH
jgi:hypothetical protein